MDFNMKNAKLITPTSANIQFASWKDLRDSSHATGYRLGQNCFI